MIDLPATGRERLGAGLLVGAAVLFVGFAVPRVAVAGFFGALTLPLVLLAADLVIAAAVLTWWYPLRPVAQGLSVFGMLVHALVMLRSGPLWTRGCSGLLLLVHSWALVQLFLMTAAEDDEDDEDGARDADDLDGRGRTADLPPDVGPDEPAAMVETPITEVVDLAVPSDEDLEEPTEVETGTDRQTESAGSAGPEEGPDRTTDPEHEHDQEHDQEHDHEERIR